MGTGYTRNDTANNIADGNVINASDLDGEFDAVQAAFNGTTGHSHDGTSGEGPQIDTAGIADNAITTAKITDANVTTAKIANANVTLAKMASNSIDSDQYVDGSIDTAHIGNLQVTTAKIAADAIDGTKLADNAVNSEHYTDGSIDRVHLAADIVDGTKIADDSIDSEHYVDGSIDTAHIANDAVTLGTKTSGNYVATITAGTGISGSSSTEGGTPTIALATAGAGSGTYGSTTNGTKIDTITLDAYGRVTAVATGATGDIEGVTAGTNLTGGGTVGTVTLNMATGGAGAGTYGSTDDGTKIDTITLDAYGRVTAVSSGFTMDRWILEDGDGTEVEINRDNEVKFVEGGGVDINWTNTSNGSDSDPYDLTFTINTSVTAGNGLTGGGQLNASRTLNVGAGTGISVSADAVALATAGAGAGTYGSTSDGNKIDQITLDAYGRVTAITTGATGSSSTTGTVTSVATGGGLTGGTITGSGTISHADTSSQSSVDNSGSTFIQDITLDTYGHVTGITSAEAGGASSGSYTPSLDMGNSANSIVKLGYYVKVDEMVFVQAELSYTKNSGLSYIRLGLPFTAKAASFINKQPLWGYIDNGGLNDTSYAFYIAEGGTDFRRDNNPNNGQFQNTRYNFNFLYRANS